MKNDTVSLINNGFNVLMKYRKLQNIGKGKFFEINRNGSLFVIVKKPLFDR